MAYKSLYKRTNEFEECDDDDGDDISINDESQTTSGVIGLKNIRSCNFLRSRPCISDKHTELLGEKNENLKDSESDCSTDNDQYVDKDVGEEEDTLAAFEEISRFELSQELPDLKPIPKEWGIKDIKSAIDKMPKPEDDSMDHPGDSPDYLEDDSTDDPEDAEGDRTGHTDNTRNPPECDSTDRPDDHSANYHEGDRMAHPDNTMVNPEGENTDKSEGDRMCQSEGDSMGQSEGDSMGQSEGYRMCQSEGDSMGQSEGDSMGQSEGDSMGQSEGDSMDQTKIISCAHCCYTERVKNVLAFKKGQHIRLPGHYLNVNFGRKLRSVYYHHAIIKQVNETSGHKVEMILIHFTKDKKKKELDIFETEEIFNLKNDEIFIIHYLRPRYRADEIVRRAESMLDKNTPADRQRRFRSYNVLTRNCEHFATWCVVGTDESFQANSVRKVTAKIVTKTAGVGCKIARFIKTCLRTSAGKSAVIFNAVKHLPGFVLGFVALAYLIYCIVMTIKHHKNYKKGELCKPCFKKEVVILWTRFGAFVATSGISYILVYFLLLSILHPPLGIILLIVIVLLSLVLQWTVTKLVKILMPLYACEKTPVKRLSDLNVGSMISFSYFGISHNAIVTEVHEDNEESTVGTLRCVHYGLESWNIFRARKVMEEFIKVNMNKKSKKLKLVNCKHLNKYQGEQVVERVRKRVGERKWNAVSNRSDHLCFWALVNNENDLDAANANDDNIGETQTKHKSSLCIGKKEVHIREEIRSGDVVNYDKTAGIIVSLDHISQYGEQEFEMEMMVYQNYRAKRIKKRINLKKKRLFVNRYHPAHCCSIITRIQRAIDKENKKCSYWTEKGFFESCVLKEDIHE